MRVIKRSPGRQVRSFSILDKTSARFKVLATIRKTSMTAMLERYVNEDWEREKQSDTIYEINPITKTEIRENLISFGEID